MLGPLDVAAAAGNRTVEYRGPRGAAATLDAGLPITGWASRWWIVQSSVHHSAYFRRDYLYTTCRGLRGNDLVADGY